MMPDRFELLEKPDNYYGVQRAEMSGYIPVNARRIIDIGCGEGKFGRILKEKQEAEIWGVELDPISATKASSKLDKVITGDISRIISGLPDKYFECAVFNDVLEHLADPYYVLNEIKGKLAMDGVIVCSIPNVRHIYVLRDYFVKKDWKYDDFGVLDKTHLRFFTKKSIVNLFEGLGYEVLRIEGINGVKTWKFEAFNLITLGFFSDTRYSQFACIARLK